jgi:hypothetical protein
MWLIKKSETVTIAMVAFFAVLVSILDKFAFANRFPVRQ